MEGNVTKFVTGESYTLAELFSGDRRIIIPDLQRDYCWGDETNRKSSGAVGELVTDFINNLIEQYDPVKEEEAVGRDSLNLGLFYGYEKPENHIQLCDGQQRLTTLYLLLGMLNKKTDGRFRRHLISDFELTQDDKEPYLNYAIRESSLYFLSDLVCRFFISNDDDVESIKSADWYFNDYNLDPSICGMLNALKKIEGLLEGKDADWLRDFGDWLLNKLTFLYYDMENRENGEETFVVINTTGEPLSPTQNLKPLVIYAKVNEGTVVTDEKGEEKKIDEAWEEIETWFWRNHQGENDTADAGFAEFLRWVSIMELRDELLPDGENSNYKYLIQQILKDEGKSDFPYETIGFDRIYGYWEAFKWIMETKGHDDKGLFPFEWRKEGRDEIMSPKVNAEGRHAVGQNDCFVLLPLMSFVYKHIDSVKTDESLQRNAKRVYEFFTNLIRIGNVSRSVNTLVRDALLIVEEIDETGDMVSLLPSENMLETGDVPDTGEKISKTLLSDEEIGKLKILRNAEKHSPEARCEVEKAFWEIQKHHIWSGEILPVIECAGGLENFDFEKFKQYAGVFKVLFNGDMEHDEIACLLRQCMILCPEPDYQPVERRPYYSFGWEWEDWNQLLSESKGGRMRHLFEYVLDHIRPEEITGQTAKGILEKFIKESDTQNDYVEFAKDDQLMSFTKYSYACDMRWMENDWQICTSGTTRKRTFFFSRRNAYILMEFGGSYENKGGYMLPIENGNGWKVWYWPSNYWANCVVFQCDGYEIKLDVRFHSSNENGKGTLEIELKSTKDEKPASEHFPELKELSGLAYEGKREVIKKECDTFNATLIKKEIEKVMSGIDEALTDTTHS